MMAKTKARLMAEDMEEQQATPGTRASRKLREANVSNEGGLGPLRELMRGVTAGLGKGAEGVYNKMAGRPGRTDEEMGELTREIGRMQSSGYKKGGKVGSASKRADGCATKGKTRGRMV